MPATGYTFASGVSLSTPSPNDPTGLGFIVGDFSKGGASYGLLDNGNISSAADLRSGTAYAATGTGNVPITVGFTFPNPVNLVGLYASTINSGGVDSPLVFTLFDTSNALIGSLTFTNVQAVPLQTKNFLGVGSSTPIGSFTVGVPAGSGNNGFFVFDDLTFQPAATPEPGTLALLASFGLTGAAFLARRRKTGA